MRVLGAILAGGQSRRFGSDKALADLGGRPMIVRVAQALAPFVEALVVCGHPAPPPGMVSVADVPHAGLGPLGGLAGALHYAREHGYAQVLSVGCDTPILDRDLIAQLRETEGPCFVMGTPIIGQWPAAVFDALMLHLETTTRRSMRGWTAAIGARPIEALHPVPNVNTRADLDTVLTLSKS